MAERLKLPVLAILLGALGALIRHWHIITAFEDELGLCDPGATSSLAMTAFFFLAAAALLLAAYRVPARTWRDSEKELTLWDQAFAARGDSVYLTLMVLSGFATLAAAPLLFGEAARMMAVRKATGEGDSPLLQLVLALCAVPGGLGLIGSARSTSRMAGRAKRDLSMLFPCLTSCIWLLEGYRANAANPVLWDYVPLLIAIACGALFHLACGSMAYDVGHPRSMLWLAGMTVAVSGAVLGGMPPLSAAVLLTGQMLCALAALWLAPGNLKDPPNQELFSPEDEDGQDELPDADGAPEEADVPTEDAPEEDSTEGNAPEDAAVEDIPDEAAPEDGSEDPQTEEKGSEDTTNG